MLYTGDKILVIDRISSITVKCSWIGYWYITTSDNISGGYGDPIPSPAFNSREWNDNRVWAGCNLVHWKYNEEAEISYRCLRNRLASLTNSSTASSPSYPRSRTQCAWTVRWYSFPLEDLILRANSASASRALLNCCLVTWVPLRRNNTPARFSSCIVFWSGGSGQIWLCLTSFSNADVYCLFDFFHQVWICQIPYVVIILKRRSVHDDTFQLPYWLYPSHHRIGYKFCVTTPAIG